MPRSPRVQNVPQEPPAPEILEPGGGGGGGGAAAGGDNEDQQWNPMEWDRAAEELTWERLLG
jgi:E3 ubiquitin-protein ligase MARCH6